MELLINADASNISSKTLFEYYLEKNAIKSFYFEQNDAKLALEKAAEIGSFEVELDGALGRRTRFQVKSVAQLVVSVSKNFCNINSVFINVIKYEKTFTYFKMLINLFLNLKNFIFVKKIEVRISIYFLFTLKYYLGQNIFLRSEFY